MLKLLCFVTFIVGSSATCSPTACFTVFCAMPSPESCPDGVIKDGAGYCGCCPGCVHELGVGESCKPILLGGSSSIFQCADGLYCDSVSHTCMKTATKREIGSCAERLAEVESRLAGDTEHLLLGLERPKCDKNGDYLGMQMSGSQAYCVTKNGTMIDGYSVYRWLTGDHMDCQCARDQYEYKQSGLIGKMFYCETNGNYAAVGCDGSVCFCQDKMGNAVGTTRVEIGQMDSLNC